MLEVSALGRSKIIIKICAEIGFAKVKSEDLVSMPMKRRSSKRTQRLWGCVAT